ncbi:MAG: hypothetical protein G01um101418_695 [Parcubacteria group bacterium Gr01-1014_18]|nr:MAG: hypothetical protein Greene041636_851 [Parcubacteria group bacterium Greene0416_36]TSC80276.1 MAG: hypothetical protein G01um101418_695 [Parcubacteria group bacterium Gr01-1014_18]TSC98255.1 MAG: hypothetical protein Greene101420_848 [Parcubacteria group bacterium Greene1014_20]TSD07002.1 MAG: hypothetical protein Greene07142_459 [Parcubacteria group bacterium Greene0714_2]
MPNTVTAYVNKENFINFMSGYDIATFLILDQIQVEKGDYIKIQIDITPEHGWKLKSLHFGGVSHWTKDSDYWSSITESKKTQCPICEGIYVLQIGKEAENKGIWCVKCWAGMQKNPK